MKTMHKEHTLTKNQQIIFDLIDKSPEPMKAYSILPKKELAQQLFLERRLRLQHTHTLTHLL